MNETMNRVQTHTVTIYTEAKINIQMPPKRPHNAPPEGKHYMICMQNSILLTDHVVLGLGRCILKPFRGSFIFILALFYMVMVCVFTLSM